MLKGGKYRKSRTLKNKIKISQSLSNNPLQLYFGLSESESTELTMIGVSNEDQIKEETKDVTNVIPT